MLITSQSLGDMTWGSRARPTSGTTATSNAGRWRAAPATSFTPCLCSQWCCCPLVSPASPPQDRRWLRASLLTWPAPVLAALLPPPSPGTGTQRSWRLSTSQATPAPRPAPQCSPWCPGRRMMTPRTGAPCGTEPSPRPTSWRRPPASMWTVSVDTLLILIDIPWRNCLGKRAKKAKIQLYLPWL